MISLSLCVSVSVSVRACAGRKKKKKGRNFRETNRPLSSAAGILFYPKLLHSCIILCLFLGFCLGFSLGILGLGLALFYSLPSMLGVRYFGCFYFSIYVDTQLRKPLIQEICRYSTVAVRLFSFSCWHRARIGHTQRGLYIQPLVDGFIWFLYQSRAYTNTHIQLFKRPSPAQSVFGFLH